MPAQPRHSPREWALCALLVGVVLAMPFVRATLEARADLRAGQAAESAGDWASATLHYRHAAQWYVPGDGADDGALASLIALGDRLAAEGSADEALFAWRASRDAIMAVRHLGVPHRDNLHDLHGKIAAAMGAQVSADPAVAAREAATFEAELDAWPERRRNPVLVLGASLGFYAWIAALALAAWRGFGPDDRFNKREFLGLLGLSFAFLAIWLGCVRFA